MRVNVTIDKDDKELFDFFVKWMADSWAQFTHDRYSESEVFPEFFGDFFTHTKNPKIKKEYID